MLYDNVFIWNRSINQIQIVKYTDTDFNSFLFYILYLF